MIEDNAVAFRTASVKPAIDTQNSQSNPSYISPKTFAGGKYTQVLQRVSDFVRSSPTETKIRAIHCMASLIGYEKDPKAPKTGPIDHRVTLMTREWFRSMSAKPEAMENLMNICKNPFPEIRMAAFTLLDAVVQHHWGEELVARTPGMWIHC